MSWLSYAAGQIVITSLVLGALKKQGAISLEPSAIHNDVARKFLTTAVSLGEEATRRAESLYYDLTK